MKFLGKAFDERFFEHRRRSTSIAGVVVAVLALCLFLYHHYRDHFWDWDLFAVGAIFVGVKLAVMTWYYLTD
jgi:hypothetical protein